MRVAIDARSAFSENKTGVGYYTWHLVHLLPRVDPETTYVAWYLDARGGLGLTPKRRLVETLRPPNLVERRMPIPTRWFEKLSMRYEVPRMEWTARFDVLFAPNFVPPPTRTRKLVLTIHDLAFRLFPKTAPLATRRWLSRLDQALHRASRIIVVSEQTRQDLLDLYPVEPDRVSIVPLGVDTEVFRPAPEPEVSAVRQRYGIEGPYLLVLGGIDPRKNIPAMISAYASLRAGVRPTLVLAGPVAPWNPEGWQLVRSALQTLPPEVRERIVFTGYISEKAKVALLSGAEALVYASLYEGFGLPVIEAMACGAPVLTSDVSALPATAGGAALLVDPQDVEAIAGGMERLLTDARFRDGLRVAGMERSKAFSWRRTALLTADVVHRACE
ncbi:MAG TPA: glycosyltransferase family 1 protein [Actinomycetota bacterium]|nr:glycosyltransferase family 1 protein [Actinomycetota bacterium]